MTTARYIFCVVLAVLTCAASAEAHVLDEYLQATLLTLDNDNVHAVMRLVPGVAAFPDVVGTMDSDRDGTISPAEQRAYAERVLGDLSFQVDGKPVKPQLASMVFPEVGLMKQGLGEIQLEFNVLLSPGSGNRRFIFENHHQERIAAYMVNCLVPRDSNLRIVGQKRNEQQSFYQLDFTQETAAAGAGLPSQSDDRTWAATFRLGMRHIAEGSDHLLFLLVLLLVAPLAAAGKHWEKQGNLRNCLVRIGKVVTAFTVGHSVSLALAASGFVRVSSRPIEVGIAVSILVSALHALRPLFPGREAGIAGFFGLIHGLAFGTILEQLGLSRWQFVTGLAGFNIGIEAMQLIVVGVTVPSLVLLSRTRGYNVLRVGGALFAGIAAIGWIFERALSLNSSVDEFLSRIAQHGGWITGTLFLISLICWSIRKPEGIVQ